MLRYDFRGCPLEDLLLLLNAGLFWGDQLIEEQTKKREWATRLPWVVTFFGMTACSVALIIQHLTGDNTQEAFVTGDDECHFVDLATMKATLAQDSLPDEVVDVSIEIRYDMTGIILSSSGLFLSSYLIYMARRTHTEHLREVFR